MAIERIRQVNEYLRKLTGEVIAREIELPTDVFVTITRVDTARDLKHATVYVTVLPDHKRVSTIRYIEKHLGLIQRLVSKQLQMKFVPLLRFAFDEGYINAQHLYDVLDTQKESDA